MGFQHLEPARRSLVSRIGALTKAARGDTCSHTQKAREAQWQLYLDKVDPQRDLPEDERVLRAKRLRKADMYRLALNR